MNLFLSRRAKAGLLLFTALTIGLGLFFSARFGGPAIHTAAPFQITTALRDSQGVGAGSDVLLRGVRVGRVTQARPDGRRTRLSIDLDGSGRRLVRTDAIARIGAKTPLGEAFVDLDPGHAGAAVLRGGAIRSAASVQLDEALEALDPVARADLQGVLKDSGRGLRSPAAAGRLGGTLDGLAQTTDQLDAVTRTLNGQAGDIAGTVRAGQQVVGALATRQASISALVADARRTLAAAGEDPAALRAALRELPGLTRETRLTLAQAQGLVTDARGPVSDLRAAATPLTGALRAAPAPLQDLASVLQDAGALRAAATPALGALRQALPALTPAVRALGPALANVVPMLDYLAPRTRTIAAWFSNTDALGRNGDAKGRWARFFIGIDPNSALGVPGAASPRQNAYTPPDDATANQPYKTGDFPRLLPFAPALAGTGAVPANGNSLNP